MLFTFTLRHEQRIVDPGHKEAKHSKTRRSRLIMNQPLCKNKASINRCVRKIQTTIS